jgi:hypothetical protein
MFVASAQVYYRCRRTSQLAHPLGSLRMMYLSTIHPPQPRMDVVELKNPASKQAIQFYPSPQVGRVILSLSRSKTP